MSTEFEAKVLSVLERIAVALEGKKTKQPVKAVSSIEINDIRTKLDQRFIVVGAADLGGAEWYRISEVEKELFPSKGIFSQRAAEGNLVDVRRRKVIGAALRYMGGMERKSNGASQFMLKKRMEGEK